MARVRGCWGSLGGEAAAGLSLGHPRHAVTFRRPSVWLVSLAWVRNLGQGPSPWGSRWRFLILPGERQKGGVKSAGRDDSGPGWLGGWLGAQSTPFHPTLYVKDGPGFSYSPDPHPLPGLDAEADWQGMCPPQANSGDPLCPRRQVQPLAQEGHPALELEQVRPVLGLGSRVDGLPLPSWETPQVFKIQVLVALGPLPPCWHQRTQFQVCTLPCPPPLGPSPFLRWIDTWSILPRPTLAAVHLP